MSERAKNILTLVILVAAVVLPNLVWWLGGYDFNARGWLAVSAFFTNVLAWVGAGELIGRLQRIPSANNKEGGQP